MKKSTLMIIADIVNNIETSNKNLYDMLELLNVTPEEMDKITEAVFVTAEKIAQLKRTNINNLNEHIDIEYIEAQTRY